jgi:hypothetical protein
VAALALTRLMSSLLFGIEPTDVVTYVAALGVILADLPSDSARVGDDNLQCPIGKPGHLACARS